MVTDIAPDHIDRPVAELVDLFRDDLAEVSFPGVDAGSLEESAAAVHAASEEVARLRRALDQAEDALRERQQALRDHARRAHAYARVYAADQPELLARVEAVVFDKPASSAPKKRRGRKPKAAPQNALPLEAPAPAAAAG